MKKLIIAIVIIAIAGVAYYFYSKTETNGTVGFKTTPVDKGTVVRTVSSSGTVQPLLQVQVGTQVNGPIKKLYVDFNSRVKEGDLIAQIDPATYEAAVTQRKASLASSKAQVKQTEADLLNKKKVLERDKELAKKELISQAELDAAQADYDSTVASLEVNKAGVAIADALLNDAQINLSYTTIKSPIDGVIVSRNVDEGQTVVASFSAATLFVIANDLKKMQIQASVAESDVGKLVVGQRVSFNVDAYPDLKFYGKVNQIRLSPTTVSNVVTYTVIIDADNPDEKLLPGMTANLTFEVERHKDVLRIPNAALRFVPSDEDKTKMMVTPPTSDSSVANADQAGQAAGASVSDTAKAANPTGADSQSGGMSRGNSMGGGMGGGMGGRSRNNSKKEPAIKQVYVLIDTNKFQAVNVRLGITDGSFTEIVGGDLAEGQAVITGTIKKGEAAMVNPFMPNFGGARGAPRPPR